MKEIESLFSTKSLRWILRIPLQLKHSSLCGGLVTSNDDSWWPPVVMGGGVRVSRVVWTEFWEGGAWNRVFHAEECIYNIQIPLSELISLSKIALLALSATFRAKCKPLSGWDLHWARQFTLNTISLALSVTIHAQHNSFSGCNCT